MATETGENRYKKYGQPTLDLVFTGEKKSLTDRVDNVAVEFTRSSTATYVGSDGLIKTATVDEARFDHDGSGNSLGLLIEEERTNRMTYSEDFTQTYYNKSFCTVGTTSVIAPDGVSTANALVEDASNDERYVQNTGGFPLGQFTTSVFVKAGTRSFCYLNFTDSGTNSARSAYFNLTTGEFQIVAAPTPNVAIDNLFAEQHPNGWWRIGATVTSGRGTQFILGPATALTPPVAVGARETYQGVNGDEALYMWGAQSENSQDNGDGLFATSYIPTSGSTSTRGADVAQITGAGFSSFYNQNEGTVFSTFKSPVPEQNTRYWLLITDGVNSTTDGYRFEMNRILTSTTSGSNAWSSTADWLSTGYTQNVENRTVFGYDRINNFNSFVNNGTLQESNTSATDATVAPTTITIGASSTFNNFSGHISRLTYWPTRLSDSDLQSLTE